MSLLVAAHGRSPRELAALVAPSIPGRWNWEARPTAQGALIIAGEGWAEADGWLILGRPLQHAWGVPGAPLPHETVAAELTRYGFAAIQNTTGPLVALKLDSGDAVTALNGIVPLYASRSGAWVTGTSIEAVRAVAGEHPVRKVPSGAHAAPNGSVTLLADAFVAESVPGATRRHFDRELDAQLADLGPRRSADLGSTLTSSGWERAVCAFKGLDEWVFLPRLADLGDRPAPRARYLELRDAILPELWLAARLVDRWLCAPGFERPAIDTLSFVGDER
jgi:hypothetical protein